MDATKSPQRKEAEEDWIGRLRKRGGILSHSIYLFSYDATSLEGYIVDVMKRRNYVMNLSIVRYPHLTKGLTN